MSTLSQRPMNAVVGQEMPHEAADLHVTGAALYTDDLVAVLPARCTRTRCGPRSRTAR